VGINVLEKLSVSAEVSKSEVLQQCTAKNLSQHGKRLKIQLSPAHRRPQRNNNVNYFVGLGGFLSKTDEILNTLSQINYHYTMLVGYAFNL
jgi:hypothetical protein